MDENPISDIESEKFLLDSGKMAFLVYRGALAEGASSKEAFLVTAAYFRGMFGGATDSTDDDHD